MKTFTLIAALLVAPAAYANDPKTDQSGAKTTDTSNTNDTSKTTDAKQKPAKLSSADLQVLAHYHELNQNEIKLGKYVARTTKNSAVKEYAQMLVDDHSAADKQLLSMAKARGAKIPMEKARTDAEKQDKKATKQEAAHIMKLKGSDLDMQYITAMVNGHEKELAIVDLKAGEAQDTEVADMARGKRETLQKHADRAKEIQKDLTQPQASTSTSTQTPTARR